MENRRFSLSLLISFLIHFFAVAFFSVEMGKSAVRAETKTPEVTYQAEKTEEAGEVILKDPKANKMFSKEKSSPAESFQREDFLAVKGKIDDRSRMKAPFEAEQPLNKGRMTQMKVKEAGREIVVPSLTAENMANPKYARYKENIRQRIKERAYQYIQNPQFQSGEVYMAFVLSANGTLRQLKIVEEQTQANEYLRTISLKSIEESNPFPPFPADLNYPELTFSVPISFRINKN